MQSKLQVTLYGTLGESPALQLPGLEGPSVAILESTLRQLVSDLYTARSLLNPEQLDEAQKELDRVVERWVDIPAGLLLDLEGHANHRGSSFGKRATAQPAQIDFENQLAIDVLKKRALGVSQFVLEDEGRIVGSCTVPLELYQGMQQYPMVWLEDSFGGRVERILRDYVIDLSAEFVALHGHEAGLQLFAQRMLQSMANIHKRLGGERHQRLAALLAQALDEQQRSGAVALHRGWIEGLLSEYYDPMYAYQRDAKAERIEFAGNALEVREYLKARAQRHQAPRL